MIGRRRFLPALVALLTVLIASATPRSAAALSASALNRAATSALSRLYASQPAAKALSGRAAGILVFPEMTKAGFMFGGQMGEGVLRKGGKTVAYYNSVAGSYGMQAGVQTFSYALFFMNQAALNQLDATSGFEVGVGPSIVVVDEGVARSITSNTVTSDVYAFIWGQRGLMAGLGIQGSKITRISK
jgi:lipid-binding SYLF domain-containing protein